MGTRGVVPAANSLVTAEKEGGERGVVGRPLPTKRGNHKWYGLYQGSYEVPGHQQSLFIPGASTSAGHTRSSTSSSREVVINVFQPLKWSSTFLCLYQVIGDSLFIPGRSELFTPVAAVWGALLGPKHSRGAILGPLACVAPGRARSTPVGRFWAASFLQLSRLRDVHNGRRPFRTAQGSSLR